MIESVKISNFQSLQDVEMEFGQFTVIVGASSSGKSAVTRAIKAVTSNKLDSDKITKGSKHAAISLKTENAVVTIERESGDTSVYKLAKTGSKEQSFTKLNRGVPTEVTEALGILPSTKEVESINFAGQFDTPYLLKEGSSAVARVLGELTNVSTIFAAVREASRRAKNASALVNLRRKDQNKLVEQLGTYANVAKQSKMVTSAENCLVQATKLDAQVKRLGELLEAASKASEALSGIKEISELPDLASVLNAQKNLTSYKNILRNVVIAQKDIRDQELAIEKADSQIMQAEKDLHDMLMTAGKCPTCNQLVKL